MAQALNSLSAGAPAAAAAAGAGIQAPIFANGKENGTVGKVEHVAKFLVSSPPLDLSLAYQMQAASALQAKTSVVTAFEKVEKNEKNWDFFLENMKRALVTEEVPLPLIPLIFHLYLFPLKHFYLASKSFAHFLEGMTKSLYDPQGLLNKYIPTQLKSFGKILSLSQKEDFSFDACLSEQKDVWESFLPVLIVSSLKKSYEGEIFPTPSPYYSKKEEALFVRGNEFLDEAWKDFQKISPFLQREWALPFGFPCDLCFQSLRSDFNHLCAQEDFNEGYSVFAEMVQISCQLLGLHEFASIASLSVKSTFSEKECEGHADDKLDTWASALLLIKGGLEIAHRHFWKKMNSQKGVLKAENSLR